MSSEPEGRFRPGRGSGVSGPSRDLSTLLRLVLDFRWIHRRVEAISFVDEVRLLHRTSVDFTLPPNMPKTPLDPSAVLVPVALLRKGKLRRFDMRDEEGRSVPVLTRNENGALAASLLIATYEAACRRATPPLEPSAIVAADLRLLATSQTNAAEVIRRRLTTGDPRYPAGHVDAIAGVRPLEALMTDLTANFLLVAVVKAQAGERRILKFSYEQVLLRLRTGNWFRRQGLRLLSWLPAAPQRFTMLASGIGAARSYHFETDMPPDVIITSATMRSLGTNRDLDRDVNVLRVHLIAEDQPRGTVARVEVRFLLRPALILPGLVISAATTLLLGGGIVLRSIGFHPQLDPASALLIALPAFFAAYVLAAEHRLTRRLASSLRASSLASASFSFVAAASLALESPHWIAADWRPHLWVLLGILSAANTVGLLVFLARSYLAERAVS
jgi:hypothetical protein